jgi:hypothetical protein
MGSPCAKEGAGDHTPRGARPQGAELHEAVAEEASWIDGRRPWRTTIHDRFGHPVQPRELYLVSLSVIDDVVDKIRDGSVTAYDYDPAQASLVERRVQSGE